MACLVLVAVWYVQNHERGAQGEIGLLGLRSAARVDSAGEGGGARPVRYVARDLEDAGSRRGAPVKDAVSSVREKAAGREMRTAGTTVDSAASASGEDASGPREVAGSAVSGRARFTRRARGVAYSRSPDRRSAP